MQQKKKEKGACKPPFRLFVIAPQEQASKPSRVRSWIFGDRSEKKKEGEKRGGGKARVAGDDEEPVKGERRKGGGKRSVGRSFLLVALLADQRMGRGEEEGERKEGRFDRGHFQFRIRVSPRTGRRKGEKEMKEGRCSRVFGS